MIIGITGGIASGKTEVAKVFQKRGAKIISGDEVGKYVVEKNPELLLRLEKTFGKEILNPNGKLNRKKLGKIAFSTDANKKRLDDLVQPYLLKELKKRLMESKKFKKPVVIDAALLIEWIRNKELKRPDYIILVTASESIRNRRIQRYLNLNSREAQNRIDRQLRDNIRKKYADFVITNNSSLNFLRAKALLLWSRIN